MILSKGVFHKIGTGKGIGGFSPPKKWDPLFGGLFR